MLIDFLEYDRTIPAPPGSGDRREAWRRERSVVAFVVRATGIERLDLGPVAPLSIAIRNWRGSIRRPVGELPRRR
ncbi:MAG: hypothetical protein QM713_17700 [Arachnia sp.]